jgi:hypothetical protein
MSLNTYETKAVMPDQWRARLVELMSIRDAVNEANAPLEDELEQANLRAEAARLEAEALASQIDDNRGRIKWFGLKREIRQLVNALQGRDK